MSGTQQKTFKKIINYYQLQSFKQNCCIFYPEEDGSRNVGRIHLKLSIIRDLYCFTYFYFLTTFFLNFDSPSLNVRS